MNKKPFVLCIAACSGGGKTTLVNEILKHLNNAKAIYFDSYEVDFLKQDYYQWSINGNNYNEWHFEPIAQDIEKLLKENLDYILLDFPVGYANDLIAKYIDYTVFIDTPLDIALARRLIRDYLRRDPKRKKIDNLMEHMDKSLSYYLTHHRITYLNHINTVKTSSDYIVDGCKSTENISRELIERLKTINLPT